MEHQDTDKFLINGKSNGEWQGFCSLKEPLNLCIGRMHQCNKRQLILLIIILQDLGT